MSDKGTESGQPGVETGAEPQPRFSGQEGVKPTSTEAVEAALEKLLAEGRLDPLLERKVQSFTDRRFSKTDKKVSSFAEKLAELEELVEGGLSKNVAIKLLETLDKAPQPVSSPEPQRGSGDDWTKAQDDILSEAGLSRSDPDVLKLAASKEWASPAEYLAELSKLAIKKAAKPTPSPGSVVPPSGTAPPKEDLRAQYEAELKNIRRGDVMAAVKLRHKYQKLGLDI
jgi:hypothetical protein